MSNEFCFATAQDGDGILDIMEGDVAKGDIALLYTRRTNPYESYIAESGKSVVGVYKNDGKIVGTIAGIPKKMFVNGEGKNVCYVSGMKKKPGLDTHINWIDAFNKMYEPLDSQIYFCSVVKENTDVLTMLKKKRKSLPFAKDMADYRTYIISPTAKVKNPCKRLDFKRANVEDADAIIEFLQKEGRRKNLFPVFETFDSKNGPQISDFYMLSEGDEIKALGALWDRRKCKQYVIKGYSLKISFLRVLNPIISMLGYVKIPKSGTEAAFTFLSFFLSKDDNEDYYLSFLSNIRSQVKKTHKMFVLGTDKNNVKRDILDNIHSISFDTRLCEVSMSEFRDVTPVDFDYTNIEVDCALL